jgi:hypothetical protein
VSWLNGIESNKIATIGTKHILTQC